MSFRGHLRKPQILGEEHEEQMKNIHHFWEYFPLLIRFITIAVRFSVSAPRLNLGRPSCRDSIVDGRVLGRGDRHTQFIGMVCSAVQRSNFP